jgi:hypothetical protein
VRLYLEKTHHKKRAGGVAEGEGHEFKTSYCERKKERKRRKERKIIVTEHLRLYLGLLLKFLKSRGSLGSLGFGLHWEGA